MEVNEIAQKSLSWAGSPGLSDSRTFHDLSMAFNRKKVIQKKTVGL